MFRTSAGRSRCDPFRGSYTAGSSCQPARLDPDTPCLSKREALPRNLQAVDGTQHGRRQRSFAEQIAGDALYVVAGHPLDAFQRLVEPELAIEVDLLPGEVGHPARGALEVQHQAALEVVLGPLELRFGEDLVL